MTFYLTDLGLVNALGGNRQDIWHHLLAGERGLTPCDWVPGASTYIASVSTDLLPVTELLRPYQSRNLQLALTALGQITPTVKLALERYGPDRVAVVAGTSTCGSAEGRPAVRSVAETGQKPTSYHSRQHEIGKLGQVRSVV